MNAAEVLSVLNSTDLQSLEAEIARAVNLPVQRDDHMKDEQRLAELFTFLQLSLDDIRTCLTRDRAALVRFGVAILGRSMIIDDGEFPKGLKQPSPNAGKPYGDRPRLRFGLSLLLAHFGGERSQASVGVSQTAPYSKCQGISQ